MNLKIVFRAAALAADLGLGATAASAQQFGDWQEVSIQGDQISGQYVYFYEALSNQWIGMPIYAPSGSNPAQQLVFQTNALATITGLMTQQQTNQVMDALNLPHQHHSYLKLQLGEPTVPCPVPVCGVPFVRLFTKLFQ